MRTLNYAQFKRILLGVDLEYRITGFAVNVERKAKFTDLHIPYDLSFFGCHFSELEFENCRFSGNLSLDNSNLNSLSFKDCQLQSLDIKDSSLDSFKVESSTEFRKLEIYNSQLNLVEIIDNHIFQEVSIGCKNKIRRCNISDLGSANANSFQTTVYLCPEQFEEFKLSKIQTDIVHIGTFGNYAKLSLSSINADYIMFENCNCDTSQIDIMDFKSLKAAKGQIHLVNTAFDAEVFKMSELQPHFETQIHHDTIDLNELIN